MKKLLILTLMVLFSIGLVSALEFDNVLDFEPENSTRGREDNNTNFGTITITNAFGLGRVLAVIRLDENTYECYDNGRTCVAQGWINLTVPRRFMDSIRFEKTVPRRNPFFEDTSNTVLIAEPVTVTVNDIGDSCTVDPLNVSCGPGGSIGTHLEQVWKWRVFDDKILPAGEYLWKIEGKKKSFEQVDWLLKIHGRELTEWALWSSNGGLPENNVTLLTPPNGASLPNSSIFFTFSARNNLTNIINASLLINTTGTFEINQTINFPIINNNYSQESSGLTLSNNVGAQVDDFGVRIRVKGESILLSGVNKTTGSGALRTQIRTIAEVNLSECFFVGSQCTFPSPIPLDANAVYIIVGNGNGTAVTTFRTDNAFPVPDETWFEWNSTYAGGSTPRTDFYTFQALNVTNFVGANNTEITGSFNLTLNSTTIWNVLVADAEGGEGRALANFSFNFVLLPTVVFIEPTPADLTGSTGNFTINVTINTFIGNFSNVTFSLFNETNLFNQSFFDDDTRSIDYFNLPDGNYTYNVSTSSTNLGDIGVSNTRNIFIDSILPIITLISPNQTFGYIINGTNDTLILEYIVTDVNLINCFFEYPSGINTTVTCNTENNITLVSQEQQFLTFFATDVNNNTGSSIVSWTFNVLELSQTFNPSVSETATETFNLNTLYNSNGFPFISGILSYNNTNFTGARTGSGDNATFTAILDIPATGGVAQQNNFTWFLTLTNVTGSLSILNSSTNSQLVTPLLLGACSVSLNNTLFNFTSAREDNITKIDPFLFEGNFEIFIGNGTTKTLKNFTTESVSEKSICVNVNSNINVNGQVSYDGATPGEFVRRDYNYQAQPIDVAGGGENRILFLLSAADSTSFVLKLQDNNLIAIPGALIHIEKFFPGLNEFRIVQVAVTDDDGKSVGFFRVETIDYRFRVVKDQFPLLTTIKQKDVGEEEPFTISLTVGGGILDPIATFENITDLSATLVFDDITGIVTYTYVDISGNFTSARLLVKELGGVTDIIICDETSLASSTTITCDVSSFTESDVVAQGFIERSPEVLAIAIRFIVSFITGIFGFEGLFLSIFIILAVFFTFIWNPTAGIIATNAIIILMGFFGIALFSPLFTFALIGISIITIILLKT